MKNLVRHFKMTKTTTGRCASCRRVRSRKDKWFCMEPWHWKKFLSNQKILATFFHHKNCVSRSTTKNFKQKKEDRVVNNSNNSLQNQTKTLIVNKNTSILPMVLGVCSLDFEWKNDIFGRTILSWHPPSKNCFKII